MRLLAALLCAGVLTGSAVLTADNVDRDAIRDAVWRARVMQALGDQASGTIDGADCGCTASIRAKERVANRDTSSGGAAQ